MKLKVTFGARGLVGANDGLDPIASAERYATALRTSLREEWPHAEIEIAFSDDRATTLAEATGCASEVEARGAERTALDLAWVVKGCVPWSTT